MTDRPQRKYQIFFTAEEFELYEKIEEARMLKGMSKKGFFLYGIATLVPEIAPEIILALIARPYGRNTKAVKKDIQNELNSDAD